MLVARLHPMAAIRPPTLPLKNFLSPKYPRHVFRFSYQFARSCLAFRVCSPIPTTRAQTHTTNDPRLFVVVYR